MINEETTMPGRPQRIAVFCGASPGRGTAYVEQARLLGEELGRRGIGLVYGGSAAGVMGAVADAALAAGAHVTGVIPEHLTRHDPLKSDVDEVHVVATMHERKALMYRLADAFIALPGGFGTFDELFETVTWAKLGLHAKPVVLLDVHGYYRPLGALLDRSLDEGFVSAPERRLVRLADTAAEAVDLCGGALTGCLTESLAS
jgi:uncharacterized protein (TIGR00730 family)